MVRDELGARRLSSLDEKLPGKLERGFDGFGAARDKARSGEGAWRRHVHEEFRERLHGLVGEKAGPPVGEFFRLLTERADDARVRVAETGNPRSTGAVEIALAVAINNVGTFTTDRGRKDVREVSVQDVAHAHCHAGTFSISVMDSLIVRLSHMTGHAPRHAGGLRLRHSQAAPATLRSMNQFCTPSTSCSPTTVKPKRS